MRDTIEMAREAGAMFEHMMWLERDLAPVFQRFEALVRADERERMYGKDIDTLLFEEHRLGFEKGSRSEREACAKVCDSWSLRDSLAAEMAEEIRARGETK
jgi:hypothetical protein